MQEVVLWLLGAGLACLNFLLIARNYDLRTRLDAIKTLAAPPNVSSFGQLTLPPAPPVLPPEIPPDFCINTNDGPSILKRCFAPIPNKTVVEVFEITSTDTDNTVGFVVIALLIFIFGILAWYGRYIPVDGQRQSLPPHQCPDSITVLSPEPQSVDSTQELRDVVQQQIDDALRNQQQQHDADRELLVRGHDAAIAALNTAHQSRVSRLNMTHDTELSRRTLQHQNDRNRMEILHDAMMEDKAEKHSVEMRQLRVKHMDDLDDQERRLASIEAELADAREQIRRTQHQRDVLQRLANDRQPGSNPDQVNVSVLQQSQLDAFRRSAEQSADADRVIRRGSQQLASQTQQVRNLQNQMRASQDSINSANQEISHLQTENASLRSRLDSQQSPSTSRQSSTQRIFNQMDDVDIHPREPFTRQDLSDDSAVLTSDAIRPQFPVVRIPGPSSAAGTRPGREHREIQSSEEGNHNDQNDDDHPDGGNGNDKNDDDDKDDGHGPSGPGGTAGALGASGAIQSSTAADTPSIRDTQGATTSQNDHDTAAHNQRMAQDLEQAVLESVARNTAAAQTTGFAPKPDDDIPEPHRPEPPSDAIPERDQVATPVPPAPSKLDVNASVFTPTSQTFGPEVGTPDTPRNPNLIPRELHLPVEIAVGNDEYNVPLPILVSTDDQVPAAFQPQRKDPVTRVYQYNRNSMRIYTGRRRRAHDTTVVRATMKWEDTPNGQDGRDSRIVVVHGAEGSTPRYQEYDEFIRDVGEELAHRGLPPLTMRPIDHAPSAQPPTAPAAMRPNVNQGQSSSIPSPATRPQPQRESIFRASLARGPPVAGNRLLPSQSRGIVPATSQNASANPAYNPGGSSSGSSSVNIITDTQPRTQGRGFTNLRTQANAGNGTNPPTAPRPSQAMRNRYVQDFDIDSRNPFAFPSRSSRSRARSPSRPSTAPGDTHGANRPFFGNVPPAESRLTTFDFSAPAPGGNPMTFPPAVSPQTVTGASGNVEVKDDEVLVVPESPPRAGVETETDIEGDVVWPSGVNEATDRGE